MNSRTFSSADAALRSVGFLIPLAITLPFTIAPRAPAPTRNGNNPCKATAAATKEACKESARSDYWIRRAGCANLPTKPERVQCAHDALDELEDAFHDCADQYAARLSVCSRLGGAGYHPAIDPANFVAVIDNPYMPLTPGTTLIYEGPSAGRVEHVEFAVTHNSKVIMGVTCIEVHDTSTINGALEEDTLDWFAQDTLGNVWYFGENSQSIENGLIISLEGSWAAGEDGALPGIVMRAQPALGALYRQEFALGTAEDVASIQSTSESLTVPYGSFTNCWKTEDFSPMEPDVIENKFFAPGIGSIREVDLDSGDYIELIDVTTN